MFEIENFSFFTTITSSNNCLKLSARSLRLRKEKKREREKKQPKIELTLNIFKLFFATNKISFYTEAN